MVLLFKHFLTLSILACYCRENMGNWIEQISEEILGHENLTFTVGLSQKFDQDAFLEMHNPNSTGFRKFLSNEEVRKRVANGTDECNRHIKELLQELELVYESKRGEYLSFRGSIAKIIELLFQDITSGTFRKFHLNETVGNGTVIRAKDVNLLNITNNQTRECIGYIGRISDFPFIRSQKVVAKFDSEKSKRSLRSCPILQSNPRTIFPDVLYEMYSVPEPVSRDFEGVITNGVFEFTQAYASQTELVQITVSPDDLQCFQESYDLPEATLNFVSEPGQQVQTGTCVQTRSSCAEPNLDVQYSSAMNRNSKQKLGYFYFQDYSDFLTTLADMEYTPITVSISYGSEESAFSGDHQICQEFANAAMTGTTFFVSSGDGGASDNNGCIRYQPSFPASCPYVTAVGATFGFKQGGEVVCEGTEGGITSGGGFSNIFTTQSGYDLTFQQLHVSEYLSKESKSAPGYNKNGRGYPDISAAGANYIIVNGNLEETVSGTSAAAPVLAGLTAFASARSGERFGWINPVLYTNESIFFDVVEGANNCAESSNPDLCCTDPFWGFEATEGWDPASGLGTLGTEDGFQKFESVLQSNGIPANFTNVNDPPTDEGLSKGEIIGISIGAVLAAVLLIAGIVCLARRCRTETKAPKTPGAPALASEQEGGTITLQ